MLRHYDEFRGGNEIADGAVTTLLEHWETRQSRGPCHWGIGTLFLQVEYPFYRYNLFFWVDVLSFFACCHDDARFRQAYEELASRRDERGRMIVERPHRNLARLEFCRKGEPSEPATGRFEEIEPRTLTSTAR